MIFKIESDKSDLIKEFPASHRPLHNEFSLSCNKDQNFVFKL